MTRATQDALLKQLKDPFDPRFVKWRVGTTKQDKSQGLALAYLDAREVMKRLDDVMGTGNWQDDYVELKDGFICKLSLFIDGQWVTKSDTADFTDIEAIKGGASSAFKRAAAKWGVGRYLYYLPKVWVDLKPAGKSWVLKYIPEMPDWAQPSSSIERWEDVAELEAAKHEDIEEVVSDDRIEAIAKAHKK